MEEVQRRLAAYEAVVKEALRLRPRGQKELGTALSLAQGTVSKLLDGQFVKASVGKLLTVAALEKELGLSPGRLLVAMGFVPGAPDLRQRIELDDRLAEDGRQAILVLYDHFARQEEGTVTALRPAAGGGDTAELGDDEAGEVDVQAQALIPPDET